MDASGTCEMRVIGFEVRMIVRNRLGIGGGPETEGERRPERRDQAKDKQRHRHACGAAKPSRERIRDQPAGMRKGELSRKHRSCDGVFQCVADSRGRRGC